MPRNDTISVCLTVEFNYVLPPNPLAAFYDPTTYSQNAALELRERNTLELLALLKDLDVKASFCIPGQMTQVYPELIEKIKAADDAHEFIYYEWQGSAEDYSLDAGLMALRQMVGEEAVKGYRNSYRELSTGNMKALVENGFLYDSSLSGFDTLPFYLGVKDPELQKGEGIRYRNIDLLEIPVHATPASPEIMESMWLNCFEYANQYQPAGLITLAVDPNISGTLAFLRRMLPRLQYNEAINVTSVEQYIKAWQSQGNGLKDWFKNPQNPMRGYGIADKNAVLA